MTAALRPLLRLARGSVIVDDSRTSMRTLATEHRQETAADKQTTQ